MIYNDLGNEIEIRECVIIGANSFLACALRNLLEKNNFRVYNVFHKNEERILDKNLLFSINNLSSVPKKVFAIFFISTYFTNNDSLEELEKTLQTNVILLKKISIHFPDSKIIHCSSVSVFKPTNNILSEESEVYPSSYYSLSKLFAERIVENHPGVGINVRISSIYGPSMNLGTFLPSIMISAITKKEIIVFGNGNRKQNYISADQAAEYLFKSLWYIGKIPLLAVGDKSFTNLQIANFVKQVIPETKIKFEGFDYSPSFEYNNKKTKTILNIDGNTDFEIINTMKWLQKQF